MQLPYPEIYLMEPTNQNKDLFDQPKQGLPGMLNVLTILTFIGCGISYLGAIWGFFDSSNYEEKVAQMEDMQDKVGDSELGSKMMQGGMEMLEKSYENRYILLISGLVFTTFCLIGAMQMRKLKKSGYLLYVIGELAPLVVTALLLGFSLTGGFAILIGGIIAIVFVILYTTQRKYLVN